MKKVLIVCHDNLLYGASKSLLDWVKNVNGADYKLLFVVPNSKGQLKDELQKQGHTVFSFKYYQPIKKFNKKGLASCVKNLGRFLLAKIYNPIAVKAIIRLCDSENIQLIHSNSLVVTVGAEAAKRINLPHIWHVREFMEEDHMMSYIYSKNNIESLMKSSTAIYISESIKRKFGDLFNGKNSVVIYNTIDYDKSFQKERAFAEDGTCNVIIVGKVTKSKGQMEAVRAIEQLKKNGFNIKLYICGEGPDEDEINKYIVNHKLGDAVELLGFRSDVTNVRKNMDIALMCSQNEAFGRVTVEGMYYKNLVIGKRTAGTEEIICNGENGYLYEPDDPNGLEKAIMYVLENKSDAVSVITKANHTAIDAYSHSIHSKIFEIYRNLIGE